MAASPVSAVRRISVLVGRATVMLVSLVSLPLPTVAVAVVGHPMTTPTAMVVQVA
jgi:hypothetical protein